MCVGVMAAPGRAGSQRTLSPLRSPVFLWTMLSQSVGGGISYRVEERYTLAVRGLPWGTMVSLPSPGACDGANLSKGRNS